MRTRKPQPPTATSPPPTTATINPSALYRLTQVLQYIPVGRSSWWAGVKSGRYPQPVKLGPFTTCWRGIDLLALIEGGDHA